MSKISKEHDGKLRELRDDLKRWQGYYDPVDDKGQHEMFVRAADAVTELLALRKERDAAVPSINVIFKDGWPIPETVGVVAGSEKLSDGAYDFYTAPHRASRRGAG